MSKVNRALERFGLQLSHVERAAPYAHKHDLHAGNVEGLDPDARRALNLIEYTKISGASYAASAYDSAYYSIEICGQNFSGQRNPGDRLAGVPFDFKGKSVLDIGCNQGGMLLHVANLISHGVGIDYDYRMINAASKIKRVKGHTNLDFFVFNLETEHLDVLDNYITEQTVDIIFLLSVCMWIDNWIEVIKKCSTLSNNLLFESNGTTEQQDEQEDIIRKTYRSVHKIRCSSHDDPIQKNRRLFICTGSHVTQ